MDVTLASILLAALAAASLQSRGLAHLRGPGGRVHAMQRYQRRGLGVYTLMLLAAVWLAWCARHAPRAAGDAGLSGQLLCDALTFVGLALAFAGLRGRAGAGAAASAAGGLGLACVGLMVLGFRLVFAAEGSEAHAFLAELCAAWGLAPADIGLLSLAYYLLAPLFLATAFAVGDRQDVRHEDDLDQPYQPVYRLSLVLALVTLLTAARTALG